MTDVLYVEDNPDEADVFARLMRRQARPIRYEILDSGTSAIRYLYGSGPDEKTPQPVPRLILMDLNLNGMSGFDIVERIRTDERTRTVPIVAFSTSDNPSDIDRAYRLGVNAYLVKPGGYQSTHELLDRTFTFWLDTNNLPQPQLGR